MRNYLVNREATFNTNQLCTIGAALESGINHGIKGIKTEMEGEKREFIVSMYFKHISLHVDAFNAMHVKEDGTPYNYFDNIKFEEADVAKLQEMLDAASNDALAKEEGHVYQVWNDGEVTSQKAGELLWQRSLHSMESGLEGVNITGLVWPHSQQYKNASYIFCTREDALKIRIAMLNLFIKALC